MYNENLIVLIRKSRVIGWFEIEIPDNDPDLVKALSDDIGSINFKYDREEGVWYLNEKRYKVFRNIVTEDFEYKIIKEQE